MWVLDGGSSVVKLALIYPYLSFCTRADARPQWEEGGGGQWGGPTHRSWPGGWVGGDEFTEQVGATVGLCRCPYVGRRGAESMRKQG